jgi:hypothetical protein
MSAAPSLAFEAVAAFVAEKVGALGSQLKRQPCTTSSLGQQGGQGAGGGRLGGAAFAADQHAADLRVDGVQDQSAFHALLADDGGERVCVSHGWLRTVIDSAWGWVSPGLEERSEIRRYE